jgi:hypothetical protein
MPSVILILNAGSSSLKFSLWQAEFDMELQEVLRGEIEKIGIAPHLSAQEPSSRTVIEKSSYEGAPNSAMRIFCASSSPPLPQHGLVLAVKSSRTTLSVSQAQRSNHTHGRKSDAAAAIIDGGGIPKRGWAARRRVPPWGRALLLGEREQTIRGSELRQHPVRKFAPPGAIRLFDSCQYQTSDQDYF